MPDLDYAWEKLALAVHGLAHGSGSVKERLRSAYLHVSLLEVEDFPPDLRDEWRAIITPLDAAMASIPGTPPAGTWPAAVEQMDEGEVVDTIQKVCWLYDHVTRRQSPT